MDLKSEKKAMFKLLEKPGVILLLVLSFLSAALFIFAPITLNKIIQNVGLIQGKDIFLVICLLVLGYLVQFLTVFTRNKLMQNYPRGRVLTCTGRFSNSNMISIWNLDQRQ